MEQKIKSNATKSKIKLQNIPAINNANLINSNYIQNRILRSKDESLLHTNIYQNPIKNSINF